MAETLPWEPVKVVDQGALEENPEEAEMQRLLRAKTLVMGEVEPEAGANC